MVGSAGMNVVFQAQEPQNPKRRVTVAENPRSERLPAGAIPEPIQMQDCVAGIPQPGGNFFCLNRPISRVKVAI
jgi:hypothetical protein